MADADFEPVQTVLEAENLDAIAFVPGANFRKIMGRDFHLMERPLVVIVPRGGPPVAVVPNLEMTSFEKTNFPGKVFDWRDEDGYARAFASAAKHLNSVCQADRIGLEAQRMRVFEQMALADVFPKARFIDSHSALSGIRIRKTLDEIEDLKRAIQISEQAFEQTLSALSVGMTEKEIEAVLLRNLFDAGAEAVAFDPIVAAAENSAEPHAHARPDYKVRAGDALLFDFGARWQGYNADITRTVFVGEVADEAVRFYETVRAANEAGRSAASAGVAAESVDEASQAVLEESEFSAFRRHKTGHGLGLEVHEAPNIMSGNRTLLESGMVFTVEPGLYRNGEYGVRIEDDMLVTEDGAETLTSLSRELQVIG